MSTAFDLDGLAARFVDAQLVGDRRAALAVIAQGHGAGATAVELQARVVRTAQAEIGRLWQANRISIAQEHLATGISQLALARLFEYAPRAPDNGKRVHIACVQGELHDLPARLVADWLDVHGFAVRYFGPDVPTHDLVGAVAAAPPDLIALSVTMSFHTEALRHAVAALRQAAPAVPIAVGGHALQWSPSLTTELGVHTAPPEPESLVALARRLTGLP